MLKNKKQLHIIKYLPIQLYIYEALIAKIRLSTIFINCSKLYQIGSAKISSINENRQMSFTPEQQNTDSKAEYYISLGKQLAPLLGSDNHWLTNISQFAGFIYQMLPDLNWAGFYMSDGKQLFLGPYQGNVACNPIAFGKGVCGKVAETHAYEIVKDVHQFADHIACDSASMSELVLPIIRDNKLLGVFDLDSPILNRFDQQDAEGIASLLELLMNDDFPDFTH